MQNLQQTTDLSTLPDLSLGFTPTLEQETILRAVFFSEDSLVVNALAGASKTTMLVAISKVLAVKSPNSKVLALAFNSRIKEELVKKLPPTTTCMTLNGLGHRAWGSFLRKNLVLDSSKVGTIVRARAKAQDLDIRDMFSPLCNMISGAKLTGLVTPALSAKYSCIIPAPDTEDAWKLLAAQADLDYTPALAQFCREVLEESTTLGFQGTIDFDDQIYLSVCFNAPYPRFPYVLVDEAQDLSPMNHRQVAKAVGQRIIVVGDRHQSIYSFRGADPSSISKLSTRFSCKELALSTTFRCDEAICEVVRKHVPSIKARPGAGPGLVQTLKEFSILDLEKPSAILCRNNAPLLALGGCLLRHQIPCQILGQDIGKGLVKIISKLHARDKTSLILAIQNWFSQESAKATAIDSNAKLQAAIDRRDCLLGVLSMMPVSTTPEVLSATIEKLFNNSAARIVLSSGHKSKGLEWPTVYHLDPWRIPSRSAHTPEDLLQEANLRYVINTRAKNKLFFLSLNQIIEMEEGKEEVPDCVVSFPQLDEEEEEDLTTHDLTPSELASLALSETPLED